MRCLTFLEIFSPSDHVLIELLFAFIHKDFSDAITESYKSKASKARFLQKNALKLRFERAFSLAYRNQVKELSTVVHVIRKCCRKGTFSFTKTENNNEFRREKVCQHYDICLCFYSGITHTNLKIFSK